jgi:hypothetical protein
MKRHLFVASVLAAAVATAAPHAIRAGEGDYIGLFSGAWSGTGIVLNDAQPFQEARRASIASASRAAAASS